MAKKTLPDVNGRDGEMDIIRERLDGQPLTGWRVPLAALLERAGVGFGSAPHPAPSSASTDLSGERRLIARQKLTRGAVAVLAVALALFTLLDGPGATRGALNTLNAKLFSPLSTPTIAASDYTLQQLPPSAQHLSTISLAPVAETSGTAFACWVNPFPDAPADQRGLAVIYRTSDFGHSWRRLAFSRIVAVGCSVVTSAVTDAAGGVGALVIAAPGYTTGGLCETPNLFAALGDGEVWTAVPWAAPGVTAPCDIQFALAGDAIFAWSTQPLITSASPANAAGRLIVTRDYGATWSAADAGMGDDAGLALVGFRPGGRILATMPDVSGPPGAAMLMESSDYGATWRDLGDPPGAFPVVYASTDPSATDSGGWGRLYVRARPLISGVPADASHALLATATPGSKWTPIPLPPLVALDDSGVESALPVVVAVGPAGSLLVERGFVPTNNESQLSPERRLWVWSAGQRRWLLDPQPSLSNADLLGWGWSHGDQTIWVTSLELGVPPTLLLFTKTYTAANLGQSR